MSVGGNGFSANGALALDSRFAKRIAVGAAGDYAALVWNVHRAENFAVHVLPAGQARPADGAVDQGAFWRLFRRKRFFCAASCDEEGKRRHENHDS